MNYYGLYDAFMIVFVAVNAVGGTQNLSIDGAIVVDNLEELVEELDPLLFFGEVDAVAGFLIQKLRLDDHSNNARNNKL